MGKGEEKEGLQNTAHFHTGVSHICILTLLSGSIVCMKNACAPVALALHRHHFLKYNSFFVF